MLVKFLKRVLFFIVATFISLNAAVFFILNSQTVQHAILEYLNSNYFQSKNLNISLGSLHLNFLTATFHLEKVVVKELEKTSSDKNSFSIELKRIEVSLDVPASYLNRQPVIRKLYLDGTNLQLKYDESGSLVLPHAFLSINEANEPKPAKPILDALKESFVFSPKYVELKDLHLVLGEEKGLNYQKIELQELKLLKNQLKKLDPYYSFFIHLKDSVAAFPVLPQPVKVSQMKINGSLDSKGKLKFTDLNLNSNVANLDLKNGELQIQNQFINSKYKADVKKIDVNGKELFALLEMQSNGNVHLSGSLSSGKNVVDVPKFIGMVKWSNLTLQGFDIYSGQAEVEIANRIINYQKAEVKIGEHGLLKAKGEFQLFQNFYFTNEAELQNVSFKTLLKGLHVSDTPVEFNLFSENLSVSGLIISPNLKKRFELFAKGGVRAKNIAVKTFSDHKERAPIPELIFDLNLAASTQGLYFDQSKIFVTNKNNGSLASVTIPVGELSFTSKKGVSADFKLDGKNIDISIAEYFLKFPTEGFGDVKGELHLDAGSSDIYFTADSHIEDALLFGIKLNDFKGKWGLSPDHAWVKEGSILTADSNGKQAKVDLKDFKYFYSTQRTNIHANVTGSLGALSKSAQYWLPDYLKNADGKIISLQFKQSGLLLHLSQWDLQMNSQLEDLKISNGSIKQARAKLNCVNGVCTNSKLSFVDIKSNQFHENEQSSLSFALIDLHNFSFDDATFKAKIVNLPISFFNYGNDDVFSGLVNSNIQLMGKWRNLNGTATASGIKIMKGDTRFGDFSFALSQVDADNLKLQLSGFYNQTQISILTQKNFLGPTKLTLSFNNFDPFVLLSNNSKEKSDLYGQLNGLFVFHADSPFSVENKNPWYLNWNGEGRFNSGFIQVGKVIFDLSSKNNFLLKKGNLSFDNFNLMSNFGKIEFGKSFYSFNNESILASMNLKFDLSKVDQVSEFFGTSDGEMEGEFNLQGKVLDPDIQGKLRLNANTLYLKSLQPSISNLNALFEFKGKKLEIQNFTAQKGEGSLSAIGSVDFTPVFSSTPSLPEVFINFTSRNADMRLQLPIVQIADTTFDADVSLIGNSFPLQLSGNVTFKKVRLFRDVGCDQIASELVAILNSPSVPPTVPFATLDINVQAPSSVTVQSQCVRGRFSTSPSIQVTGNTSAPVLSGSLISENSSIVLVKSRFEVKRAQFYFLELQKYDPNVDIQMETRISNYTVYANMSGRLSRSRLDLSISPATLANGDRITQADIISIISSRQIPLQSSSANLLSASSGFFSFIGMQNFSENSFLNNTVNTVTGGLVDNVNIAPTTQNGQFSWRVTASRSLSQRLNLGLSYESGSVGTTQSAYVTIILNDTVSLFSSFNQSALQQQQTSTELFNGLRFRFGSQ